MAFALLFAFVGFINSRLGPGVDDRAAQIAFLANEALQPRIDPRGRQALIKLFWSLIKKTLYGMAPTLHQVL